MRGLFAARALKKCEAIGVYDGEARLPTMNNTWMRRQKWEDSFGRDGLVQ